MNHNPLVVENDFGRAVFAPSLGVSLRSLVAKSKSESVELLKTTDPSTAAANPFREGCFLMAPWPNRIRDGAIPFEGARYLVPVNSPPHAIHGTVRDAPFAIDARSSERAVFSRELGKPWPFDGKITVEVALRGPALVQTATIESAGQRFPAGFGWHPWFRRAINGGDVKLTVDAAYAWELDSSMTPTGAKHPASGAIDFSHGATPAVGSLDHCFRITDGSRVSLEWPGVKLEIASSERLGHLQVYTPADAICVEPQTCCVNAFQLWAQGVADTGAVTVTPESPLQATTEWTWAI